MLTGKIGDTWPPRVLLFPAYVFVCVCPCINHEIVHGITYHMLKLGSPNWDNKFRQNNLIKIPFVLGAIDLAI